MPGEFYIEFLALELASVVFLEYLAFQKREQDRSRELRCKVEERRKGKGSGERKIVGVYYVRTMEMQMEGAIYANLARG